MKQTTAQQPVPPASSLIRMAPSLLVLLTAVIGGGARDARVLLACTGLALAGLIINRPPVAKALRFLAGAGIIFFLWHLFTLYPLPLTRLGAPRDTLFSRAHHMRAELQTIMDPSLTPPAAADPDLQPAASRGTLTLNQAGTRRFMMIAAGAWAMFWLSATMTPPERMRFLAIIVTIGAVAAVFALIGIFIVPPGDRAWWLFPGHHEIGAGPFINQNHFAFFCGLLTPAALSLILAPAVRTATKPAPAPTPGPPRWDLDPGLPGPRRQRRRATGRRLFFGFCLLVLITATISTLSRGGMVMMLLACMTGAVGWVRGKPAPALAGAVIMLTVLFSFLYWPSQEVQEKIGTLRFLHQASPNRPRYTQEALSQWRDFRWTGGGADSYRALYGIYKSVPWTSSPAYAHNEYAQIMADHGLIGALLFGLVLTGVLLGFGTSIRDYLRRPREPHRWPNSAGPRTKTGPSSLPLPLLAACGGALAGMLFHFTCEFPARVGLNAFLAAAILGLAMPANRTGTGWGWQRWPIPVSALLMAVFLIAWRGDKLRLDEPHFLARADLPTLSEAAVAAPSYWVVWARLAQLTREQAERQFAGQNLAANLYLDPFAFAGYSLESLRIATELNPLDWRLWQALARTRMRFAAHHNPDEIAAALRQAVLLAPRNRGRWQEWLQFALAHQSPEQAWEIGRLALEIGEGGVPARVWLDLYQWVRTDEDRTEELYQTLLILTELQPNHQGHWRERARIEEERELTTKALASRRRLTEINPDNWNYWVDLGRLLLTNGYDEEANIAFSRAVRLRPDSRDRIDRMWREIRLNNQ